MVPSSVPDTYTETSLIFLVYDTIPHTPENYPRPASLVSKKRRYSYIVVGNQQAGVGSVGILRPLFDLHGGPDGLISFVFFLGGGEGGTCVFCLSFGLLAMAY